MIEIDKILTKKIKKRELEIPEAEYIYRKIRNLPFITISCERFSKDAFFLSNRFPITQYNACYLALTVNIDGQFFTADKRLVNGIQNRMYSDYVIGIDQI